VRTGSQGPPPAPDRRYAAQDKTQPAPPIVVVTDPAESTGRGAGGGGGAFGSPERAPAGLSADGAATPPRVSPLNRLRSPKDTIPIVGKPPRKQRSSRFVPNEKIEIERLPPFMGERASPDVAWVQSGSNFLCRDGAERASAAVPEEAAPVPRHFRLQRRQCGVEGKADQGADAS
jgi:hypothetical protein